jgi:glycosyltransferase involved in cell wall biosynthesis
VKREVEVSVLMGVFNESSEWLASSIESILNQTFANFEFIIINDNPASPVNKSILELYSEKDDRIKIISNSENIGLTKSMNIALEIAKGQFIARMDADDISLPTRLETQLTFLKGHPEYIACGSNAVVVDKKNSRKGLFTRPESNEDIQSAIFYENPMIHPTLFFRRLKGQCIEYDAQIKYAQDYELVSTLSRLGKLFNIQEPLLLYRRSTGQISVSKLSEQNKAAYRIRKKNIELYLRRNYSLEESFEFDDISPVYDASMKFFRTSRHDRKNLSVLIYSLVYYSKSNPFRRMSYTLRSQVISGWTLTRRTKLLLSFIIKFPELRVD